MAVTIILVGGVSFMSKASSPCQNCIFVETEDNKQTGCQLNLLDHYYKQGCLVEAFNENGEFYVINGRFCYFRRLRNWLMNHKKDIVGQIRKELYIPYMTFILMEDELNKEEGINNLRVTIKNVLGQSYPPKFLVVCKNIQTLIPNVEIQYILERTNVEKWRISNILEKGTEEKCIEDIAKINATRYTLHQIIRAGTTIDQSLMSRLLDKVVMDNLRFDVLIINKDAKIKNSLALKLKTKDKLCVQQIEDVL